MLVTVSVKRLRRNGAANGVLGVGDRARRKAAAGVLAAAQVLYEASQKEVPRDTNYLAETGRVYSGEDAKGPYAVVGYGGRDFPARYDLQSKTGKVVERHPCMYAVRQHEVPQNHDAGQKDHYLSDPCSTAMPEMKAAFLAAAASVH